MSASTYHGLGEMVVNYTFDKVFLFWIHKAGSQFNNKSKNII